MPHAASMNAACCGFSTSRRLAAVLDGHPHAAMGGTIETLELLTMPGR